MQSTGAHAGAQSLTVTYDEDVATNGILVAVIHLDMDLLSGGGQLAADITEDDYEPWFGTLRLSQNNINERETVGNYWFIHVAAHEVGHILGITSHEGGWHVPSLNVT